MASLCLLHAYVGILAQFCNNCIPKRGVFLSKRIFAYIRIGICVDTVQTVFTGEAMPYCTVSVPFDHEIECFC